MEIINNNIASAEQLDREINNISPRHTIRHDEPEPEENQKVDQEGEAKAKVSLSERNYVIIIEPTLDDSSDSPPQT